MKHKGLVFSWTLTLLMAAQNLYLWGGVAETPTIGKAARDFAVPNHYLAWTYLVLGDGMVNLIGSTSQAQSYAEASLGKSYYALTDDPDTGMDQLISTQSILQAFFYYLAPVLLLISMVLQVRREKAVKIAG